MGNDIRAMKFWILCVIFIFPSTDSCSKRTKRESILSYIQFQIYNGLLPGEYTSIPVSKGMLFNTYSGFNSSQTTIFYFPGWGEDPRAGPTLWPSLQTLIPAFRSLKNTNLILLDFYDLIRFHSYSQAMENSTYIGEVLAKFFADYIPKIQTREKIRFIGHSLGVQIMSHIARNYMKITGQTLSRITGLDPAGPGYRLTENHLKSTDADYVDVIVTNWNALGMVGCGTINFYVNGGAIQPFCISSNWTVGCAHFMSWRIYSEAIYNSTGFLAKKCTEACKDTFPVCVCNDKNLAYIGFESDSSKTGNYFLKTNTNPPFAQGQKGIKFI